jgi:hypothetical protein
MHFLLAGRVRWRRLPRPAILTAFGWIGLELFSAAYFSPAIISDSRLYGPVPGPAGDCGRVERWGTSA